VWFAGDMFERVMMFDLSKPDKRATHYRDWNDRTYRTAHKYIAENFDTLTSGDVLDIEFILGEVDKPKEPHRFKDTIMIKEIKDGQM
jgi:hypothetical protein